MHTVEIGFMAYLKDVHQFYAHNDDAWAVAHKLGLGVEIGYQNALSGKTITLTRDTYYSRKAAPPVIWHEIAHHLMIQSGVEEQIFRLRGSYEEGLPSLERLTFHGALVLRMPQPMLNHATQQHGHTPAAIVCLHDLSGAPLTHALRRWVYAEVAAMRAAWMVNRCGLVMDAAAANYWLPFWKYDTIERPCGGLTRALTLPVQQRTMGMVAW